MGPAVHIFAGRRSGGIDDDRPSPARSGGCHSCIAIREGIEATRPAVDEGITGSDAEDILTGRPTVLAPRIADGPRLDGRLDDDVWRTASRLTEFVQQRPLDGAPASE